MNEFEKNPVATDEDYFKLASIVYDDDALKKEEEIKGYDGQMWTVIESINLKNKNGLQAIAVVPAKHYHKDKTQYDNITFVFRGTEFGEFDGDLTADTNQIAFGNKKNLQPKRDGVYHTQLEKSNKDTQFDSSLKWVDSVINKYNPTSVSSTGHSLGGGLSKYVAVERNFYSTTFAGPNIYRLLSKEGKKRVDSGEVDSKVIDYTHDADAVGKFEQFNAPMVGKQFTTKSNGKSFWLSIILMGEHPTSTFNGMFHSNGSVRLHLEPDEIIKHAQEIQEISMVLLEIVRNVEQFQQQEEEEIANLKRQLKAETGPGGKYHLLEEYEVDEAIREIAKSSKNGHDYFHDAETAEKLIHLLRKKQKELDLFGEDIAHAARSLRDKDNELKTNFDGLVVR